jgi:hypothetical protein
LFSIFLSLFRIEPTILTSDSNFQPFLHIVISHIQKGVIQAFSEQAIRILGIFLFNDQEFYTLFMNRILQVLPIADISITKPIVELLMTKIHGCGLIYLNSLLKICFNKLQDDHSSCFELCQNLIQVKQNKFGLEEEDRQI